MGLCYECETCPTKMVKPVLTLVTDDGSEYHFDKIICLKKYIDAEVKKLRQKDSRFIYGEKPIKRKEK